MTVDVYLDYQTGLKEALKKEEGKLHFIIDDDGAISWADQAVEFLEAYYRALDPNGSAWIRIPKTIWVMQKNNRRILLSEYLLAKFPGIFRSLILKEMEKPLAAELSQPKEIIEMKKDRAYAELKTGVKLRSSAHSLKAGSEKSKPVLEYGEES